MLINKSFALLYLFTGMALLVGPFLPGTCKLVGTEAVLLGGVGCLVLAGLQNSELPGRAQVIATLFLFSNYITMLLPFALLALWPSSLMMTMIEELAYNGGIDEIHLKSVAYVLGVTVAFWVGARLALGRDTSLAQLPSNISDTSTSQLFAHRHALLVLTTVFLVARIILVLIVGVRDIESLSKFGWLHRLFPVDLLVIMVMFLLVRFFWQLTLLSRCTFLCVLALYALLSLQCGQRGVLLTVPMMLFWAHFFYRPKGRIPVRVLAVSPVYVLVLPFCLALISAAKNIVMGGGNVATDYNLATAREYVNAYGFEHLFTWMSARVFGYSVLVDVIAGLGEQLNSYCSPATVFISTVRQLIPDRLLPDSMPDTPGLGTLASVLIDGHSWDVQHNGAWYGVPMLWAFFGLFGLLLMFCHGWLLLRGATWVARKDDVFQAIYYALCIRLTFYAMLSGNVDGLIAQVFTNTTLTVIMYKVYKLSMRSGGDSARRKFKSPGKDKLLGTL